MKHLLRSLVLAVALIAPLAATSQTVLGIVMEIVEQKGRPHAVVHVLWDSCGEVPEQVTRAVDLQRRWKGCVISLDGEVVEADAIQAGQLVFLHFNRQSLRIVAATSLPEGRLGSLRPAGQGFLVASCPRVVVLGDERRKTPVGLDLFLTCDGDAVTGITGQATGYTANGIAIASHGLKVAGGRVTGPITLTIPGRGGKNALPPLPLTGTLDVPVAGGEGGFTGTVGEQELTTKVNGRAFAPVPVPEKAVTWMTIPSGTHVAVVWQDGVAQLEHAATLFAKGYITGKATAIEGTLKDGRVTLTATFDCKGTERKLVLEGVVCGDRVGGTVTEGDKKNPFVGGILPADCTWRGYLGHDDQKDIPPRE